MACTATHPLIRSLASSSSTSSGLSLGSLTPEASPLSSGCTKQIPFTRYNPNIPQIVTSFKGTLLLT